MRGGQNLPPLSSARVNNADYKCHYVPDHDILYDQTVTSFRIYLLVT